MWGERWRSILKSERWMEKGSRGGKKREQSTGVDCSRLFPISSLDKNQCYKSNSVSSLYT